ncbi:MAG: hypothetical protein Pars2KO_32150 [Parasphingorhabdus sp.]
MGNAQEIDLLPNDQALRKLMRSKLRETGLEIAEMLRDTRDVRPAGLTLGTIVKWIDGSTKLIRKDHVDWLMNACDHQIAMHQKVEQEKQRITIDADMHALLLSEAERTQMGAIRILRLAPRPLPDGLNTQKLQCWISGHTKTARKTHWEFVMRLYASVKSPSPSL